MRVLILIFIGILVLNPYMNKEENQIINDEMINMEYASFGKTIIPNDAIAAKSVAFHCKTKDLIILLQK